MRVLIIGISAAGSDPKTTTIDDDIRLPKERFRLTDVRVTIMAWTVHNPLGLKGVRQAASHESICAHHHYQGLELHILAACS